jgi:hypothetical protein
MSTTLAFARIIKNSAPTNPVPGQITEGYAPGTHTVKNQVPSGSPVHASYDANGNQTAAEGMGDPTTGVDQWH